jgi:hypothetical protein
LVLKVRIGVYSWAYLALFDVILADPDKPAQVLVMVEEEAEYQQVTKQSGTCHRLRGIDKGYGPLPRGGRSPLDFLSLP